jgi:hypothetical protein
MAMQTSHIPGCPRIHRQPRRQSLADEDRLAVHGFQHALSGSRMLLQADRLAERASRTFPELLPLHTGLWHDMLMATFAQGCWRLGKQELDGLAILADLFIGILVREKASARTDAPPFAPDTLFECADRALARFLHVASRPGADA